MMLTENDAARFERDGYLSPLRAISAAEANQYRAELEAFEARHGGRLKGVVRFKVHLLMPWVDRLMRHPAILDPVERLARDRGEPGLVAELRPGPDRSELVEARARAPLERRDEDARVDVEGDPAVVDRPSAGARPSRPCSAIPARS